MNKIKIFIDCTLQQDRFDDILNYSIKYKLLDKYNIEIINNYKLSDLILFLVNSRNNLINLNNNYDYIYKTNIPIILLERQDSSITWCRDIHKIKNLKAIFKNRILRNKEMNNTSNIKYGKYNFHLVKDIIKNKNIEISKNKSDIGIDYYNDYLKFTIIKKNFLNNIIEILWDFHSSPLCKHKDISMEYFRNNNINHNKKYDIFCVNQKKTNNYVNDPRKKAKEIVNSLSEKYKVITNKLNKNEYEQIFSQSKICVACWGFGEWVHMDAYAMYAGVLLIKPNTDHVLMYPDIYKSNEIYIQCNHDYSNLKEVIEDTLKNYDKYKSVITKNREILMNITEEKCCDIFWKNVVDFI